jgi:hypothetical protein
MRDHHGEHEGPRRATEGRWFRRLLRVLTIVSASSMLADTPAFAQRGGEAVQDPVGSSQAFHQRAWRIQEGKLRIVSDIEPERSRETFDKTRWLLSTIELVFDGMATRRPSDGLEVFYAGDRNDYLSILRTEANADGSNTAGMAAYGGRRTMLFVRGLEWRTIQHEAWHASRSVFIPNMPTWLDEGLAEIFEHGAFLDDQFTIGGLGVDDLQKVRALFETGNWLPVGEFVRSDAAWNDRVRNGDVQGFAQYVQAWAICHFLLFAEDGEHRGRINRFMNALNRGADTWTAFDAAIGANGRSVEALDREVRAWFESATPVELTKTHDTLESWADSMGADLPERGRFDFDAIKASLIAWMSDAARGSVARTLDDAQVTVKAGRRGQGPIVRIDPLDGLSWTVTWSRNDTRRRRRGDDDDAPADERTWIPSVQWALSG